MLACVGAWGGNVSAIGAELVVFITSILDFFRAAMELSASSFAAFVE